MNRNARLICMLTLGLILCACGGNQSQKEELLTVKTITVSTCTDETAKEFPILTQPFRTTELSFRVSGPIKQLDAYAGNHYRRGETIAEIDPRDYRIRANVPKPSTARQKPNTSVSVHFMKRIISLPALTRKHGRSTPLPKPLLKHPSMNWKTPASQLPSTDI